MDERMMTVNPETKKAEAIARIKKLVSDDCEKILEHFNKCLDGCTDFFRNEVLQDIYAQLQPLEYGIYHSVELCEQSGCRAVNVLYTLSWPSAVAWNKFSDGTVSSYLFNYRFPRHEASLATLKECGMETFELAQRLSTDAFRVEVPIVLRKELYRARESRKHLPEFLPLVKYRQQHFKKNPEKAFYELDLSDVREALDANTKACMELFASNCRTMIEDMVMNKYRKGIFDVLERMETGFEEKP